MLNLCLSDFVPSKHCDDRSGKSGTGTGTASDEEVASVLLCCETSDRDLVLGRILVVVLLV